eukprot:9493297-Pyramimonas_sp.AAC.1
MAFTLITQRPWSTRARSVSPGSSSYGDPYESLGTGPSTTTSPYNSERSHFSISTGLRDKIAKFWSTHRDVLSSLDKSWDSKASPVPSNGAVERWFKVLHQKGELTRVIDRATTNLRDLRVLEVFCVSVWATCSSRDELFDDFCTEVQPPLFTLSMLLAFKPRSPSIVTI